MFLAFLASPGWLLVVCCNLFNKPVIVEEVEHPISVVDGLAILSEIDGDGGDAVKSANIA